MYVDLVTSYLMVSAPIAIWAWWTCWRVHMTSDPWNERFNILSIGGAVIISLVWPAGVACYNSGGIVEKVTLLCIGSIVFSGLFQHGYDRQGTQPCLC